MIKIKIVDQDKNIEEQTSAVIDNEFNITAIGEKEEDVFKQPPVFSSSNNSIATINQNGVVKRVSDGYITIKAKTPRLSKGVKLSVSRTGGTTTQIFISWVSGSLAKEINDAVDNRINGLTPSNAINIFDTQDHNASNYIRNTGCWCNQNVSLDLTCISPWNSNSSNKKAGTLISPRHIIFAEHFQISNGSTIRFVTMDNQVIERTMTSKQSVGPSNNSDFFATDLSVGLLDSDITQGDNINFCKVLPSNFENYLPHLSDGMASLTLDQEEKALITNFFVSNTSAAFSSPKDSNRLNYFESKISGDSGNPAFLIINDELILVTTWTFGGAGSGPNISQLHTEVNSTMASLGGGYQLSVVDLSSFIDYS